MKNYGSNIEKPAMDSAKGMVQDTYAPPANTQATVETLKGK